ncbi:GATA transcription factor 9 [Perilla frutescens var. hirtella]|uniref:GATA transcription factor 9 n=1 Tax=Perilla frutescens var. hirtella TaxID=608512 RepID=A0AAD4PB52_PERFH|nr:GATA transcription factor 9 [Perilla frutescens var. hirtella]
MSYLEEQGLCIPQDRLEDVDFFPNFYDDWIRLDHVMESDVDDVVGQNQEDSRKFLRSNSREIECKVEEDSRKFLRSNSGEIECKVASRIDVCFGQDLQEHKLRENITNTLYFDNDDDDRHSSISVEHEDVWKGKKPRTKIMRKENRNLMFPELHDSNRSSFMLKSKKIKKRCSHCQAEDTPQWRTGPTGRNSLCNACGLRYKVGRLVSNYRPAASPSFDSSKHSNFYRRLIRRNMEVVDDYGMPI